MMRQKQSMKQYVYQTLKKAILYREIAPGTQLVEQSICSKLDVSRTPVRNAIGKLEKDGLITVYPNRGAFVTFPTADEINQAFRAREEVEKIATFMAIDHFSSADIKHLRSLINKEQESYKKNDIFLYLDINKQFHMAITKKSNNKFLIEFMEKILNQMNVYFMLFDVFYETNIEESKRYLEHEAIVNAIEAKDKIGVPSGKCGFTTLSLFS